MPWGPPSGNAVRLRDASDAAFFEHTPAAALLSAAIVQHAVGHEGVGAAVSVWRPCRCSLAAAAAVATALRLSPTA